MRLNTMIVAPVLCYLDAPLGFDPQVSCYYKTLEALGDSVLYVRSSILSLGAALSL